MIYYDSYNPNLNDKNICLNYYGLGTKEKRFIWPLSYIGKKHHKKQTKSKQFSATGNRKSYNSLINFIGGDEIIKQYTVSPEIIRWIEHFQPEIIYCHISSLNTINFVNKVHSIFDIPIVIHIMDDWFNVCYKKGLFAPVLRYRFIQEFKQLLSVSSVRMGIGQKMCDQYHEKFDFSFLPFSNPVEVDSWSSFNSENNGENPFKIVYVGTINSKNMIGLNTFCEIVGELNSQGQNIQFEIYTFQPRLDHFRQRYNNPPSVTMHESPKDDDQVARVLGAADLLFLPIDFTKRSVNRMRYSIFAKIPVYMASGTPILLLGPSAIASVEYAQQDKWAYVVDKNDRDELKKGLIEIMSNSDLRDKFSSNALKVVRRDFDAVKVRASFRKELLHAANLKAVVDAGF